MKKIHMIAVFLVMFPTLVFAKNEPTYYAALQVNVSSSGGGKVYADTTSTETSTKYGNATYAKATTSKKASSSSATSVSIPLYAFAKADYGYNFKGWSKTNDGTLESNSSVNPFTVNVDAKGDSKNNPTTENRYAVFEEKTHYTVNLAVPAVSGGFASYSVTGDNGYSGSQHTAAGSFKAYYDEKYTITCTRSDEDAYEFKGWEIDGVLTETSSTTLSQKFTADTTVKAVLKEKTKYAVTLAKPAVEAGFQSYTVTRSPTGTFNGSSFSQGGNFEAHDGETYTFKCTISNTYKYEFVGWAITENGTTTTNTSATLERSFSASSTTVAAVLREKAHYTVNLERPAVSAGFGSYAVTGPTGFDGSGLSNGGTMTAYYDGTYKFTCTVGNTYAYEFVGWDVNGTVTQTSSTTLSTQFSSGTTVKAVLKEKTNYAVTLAVPALAAGFDGYTVTGPSGFDGSGLSNGGEIRSYYDGGYSFECAITDDEKYKFVKWTVTDSNGKLLEESTDRHFSKTFTAPVTVTAVLAEKEAYEVTFVTLEHVTRYSITGPNGPVTIADGKATVNELNSYTINCEYDDENYELVNWTVSDASGSTESSASTLTKTFNSDAEVTVTLAKIEAFIATCPAVPSGCSYKVRGGTTTSDETVTTAEKKVKGTKGQPLTVTLSTATAGSGYVFAGWYIENQDGSKTYISKDSSVSQTFETHVTIGADFVSASSAKAALVVKASGGYGEYDDLKEALDSLESGDTITICKSATLAESAGVPQGVTMTVSSGVTLTVASGQTLYVDGAVTNNGTISGTVSKCTKLIKQTGDGTDDSGKPKPFNPYGSVKYWKTTITSPSITISGVSASSHTSIVNGYGVTVYRGATASAFVCSANTSVAWNHATGVVSSKSSASDAYSAVSKGSLFAPASQMVLLTAKGTFSGSGNFASGFTCDCAGNDFTISGYSQMNNAANPIAINGGTVTFVKNTNAKPMAINCSSVSQSSVNANQDTYSSQIHLLDCSSVSLASKWPAAGGVFIYSGTYTISFTANLHACVYGGYFKNNPGTEGSYLATGLNLVATQDSTHNNYYWVHANVPDKVAQIGDSSTSQYATLQEAVNAVTAGQTIKLLKNYEANETVTIGSGKSFTLNLNGYAISGTSGTISNNGTLQIGDCSGGNGSCSYAIVNNGTMDVIYGTYSGVITLNSGMMTTYNGTFNSTFVFGSGVSDPADVLMIRGGKFKRSVKNLLVGDFCEATYNGLNYVGEFPYAIKSSANLSGAEKSWSLTAVSNEARNVYMNAGKARSSCSSDAVWKWYAELDSALTPYVGFSIDCVISFDRPVAKSSVKAYANAKVNVSDTLDRALAANESYRVLSPRVTSAGYAQISFARFITGNDCPTTLSAGIADVNSANPGTVATIELELCHSNRTTHVLNRDYAIATCRYMLDGKKAAIDRGASRVAYSSLTAAVADVQDGEMILVGADTSENVTFNNPGTYIINEYGFAFTGSATANAAYEFSETIGTDANGFVTHTYVVSAAGPAHPADYVVIPSEHLPEWESDNGITTGSTEAEIREALKQEDANGIAKWENVVMGQNGADKPAIETSTNGTETVADMVVSFKAPENTGYTVKYAFDKVDSAGLVVANGEGEPQDNPQLDLTQVSTAGTPAYFKMRAVLESNDHSITTNVPVEHTVGVLKVDSSATYTILAVPWKSFHNTDVNVAELVHAASLSENDMLSAYDESGNVKSWYVKNGVWASATDVSVSGEQQTVGAKVDPTTFYIARGKGVWLKRSDTSKPIYLMGMPTSGAATTTLPAASGEEPSWNLLASPKLEAVDLKTSGFSNTDEIIVPTAGTPKHYTYNSAKGGWGYPGATVTSTKTLLNGQTITVISVEHKTDDTTITPGTGFWYLNKGDEKTINWKND